MFNRILNNCWIQLRRNCSRFDFYVLIFYGHSLEEKKMTSCTQSTCKKNSPKRTNRCHLRILKYGQKL